MFWRGFVSYKKVSKLLKYTGISGIFAGSLVTFLPNENDLDSYGVVRLGRAAYTVLKIGAIYRTMYSEYGTMESEEYQKFTSYCHKKSAEELLKLCFLNKGVYIKVGQHLAALEYLIPTEYVDTMKVLHSNAPSASLEDVYKVIKEDLLKDVSNYLLFE